MRLLWSNIALGLMLLAGTALAANHHSLNGTWKLIPNRTEYAGEPAVQTGTVTINDREHNIYISRSFSYDGQNQTSDYNFTTDGRENSSIRQGKTFKTKAKWDGRILNVTTIGDKGEEHERYSLEPDGTMMLVVERPGHSPMTLHFEQ